MKIANTDREFLNIFWTTLGNSMKFSGKMCFEITLKVTKNQDFILPLEHTFFEKPQGMSIWSPPPPSGILGLRKFKLHQENQNER